MKKINFLVTFMIVLTIIGGAYSFKAKKDAFCVTTDFPSTDCTTYITNKTRTVPPYNYKYYPNWDGNPTICTVPNNNLCTAWAHFVEN